MASSKINSVDLGPIWFQSGNGVPDHIAMKGTIYIDLDTAIEYINKNGFVNWEVNGGGSGPSGPDIYISGMSFNTGNYDLILNRNDGVNFTESLAILASDMTVTGGTYNVNTGIVTFGNNSGGTFNVTGFTSGMTDSYTTGATLVGNIIGFDNNIYGSNFYSVDLTSIMSAKTNLSLFDSHTGNTSNPHQTSFSSLTSTAHTHSVNDIINLSTQLNSKFDKSGGTINSIVSSNSTNSIFEIYDASNIIRTKLEGRGSQSWKINSTAGEVGSISYGTPNNNPGILFLSANGNGRTDIRLNSQTGGLSLATTTSSVNPPTQLLLTTNGNLLINTLTDNNTDKLQVNGSLVATTIKKSGGTSSQFLKADGSIDSNTYVSTVFGRTGNISAVSGDYNTNLVIETTNKRYQTDNQRTFNDATSSIQTQLNGKQPTLTNPITGTGTSNYIPKFTSSGIIGNSSILDDTSLLSINKSLKITGGITTLTLEKTSNNVPIITFLGATANSHVEGGDDLNLYTNGNLNLKILKSGFVGIGTSSPTAKIDVVADINTPAYGLSGWPILRYSTGDVLDFGSFGSTWNAIRFMINNSESMRIENTGNVLIGSKLQVSGTISTTGVKADQVVGANADTEFLNTPLGCSKKSMGSSIINAPITEWGTLTSERLDYTPSPYGVQTYLSMESGRFWTRYNPGTSWSAWVEK